jgi:hypothetical protein
LQNRPTEVATPARFAAVEKNVEKSFLAMIPQRSFLRTFW